MSTLFIRALSPPQPLDTGFEFRCEWLILDNNGHCQGQGTGDFPCPAEPQNKIPSFLHHQGHAENGANGGGASNDWTRNPTNVVVFVPAEYVLSISCEVPGRSASQIRRALPYVVEEFIASDIDRTHLASSAPRRGQPVRCAMIDEGLLRDWLVCLAGLGVHPGYLVPETEMLPLEPQGASLLSENGRVLLRAEDQAASIDRGNLIPVLASLDLDRLVLIGTELTDLEASQLDLEIGTIEPDASMGDGGVLAYCAQRWPASDSPLNLLQGDHAPILPEKVEAARWRGVAWLATAWLVLGLAGMAASGIWSSIQADALENESMAVYRDIFPGDRTATVQNIRRRMQAQLGERPATVGRPIIDFAGDLAAVMDGSMTLMGIDYNEARGEFATEILVRRYDDVERIREALEARAVEAEITSAEQVEKGVQARLRIRGS